MFQRQPGGSGALSFPPPLNRFEIMRYRDTILNRSVRQASTDFCDTNGHSLAVCRSLNAQTVFKKAWMTSIRKAWIRRHRYTTVLFCFLKCVEEALDLGCLETCLRSIGLVWWCSWSDWFALPAATWI